MTYQFLHIDSYGRVGSERTETKTKKNGQTQTIKTKVRSAREILAEQQREAGACPHIDKPTKPGLLYGVQPMDVLPLVEEWTDQATDARGHKLRKDGLCVLIGVASLPREREDDFPQFAENTLIYLKEKYGDRLKSVVVHNDEAHPHLHFTVVPKIGERFDDIHDGFRAKRALKAVNSKAKAGDQNLAYIEAMRKFQDDFSEKVGMKNGLTRIGPGRRRLTRAQWQAEKAQAKFFANAKAVAKVGFSKGFKRGQIDGKAQAQEEAEKIGQRVGTIFTGFLGRWHKPSQRAQEELERVKAKAQKAKKAAEAFANLAKETADKRIAEMANEYQAIKIKNKTLIAETEKLSAELDRANALLAKVSPEATNGHRLPGSGFRKT